VSTVIFWREVFDEQSRGPSGSGLRHLVSRLVQLALVALLVAALTDPSFAWERSKPAGGAGPR
jgi:hypothetical protein